MARSSTQQFPKIDLPALTSVRGIAAFWVLLYHLRYEVERLFPVQYEAFEPLFKSGFLGVDLFFVLSGFVIALNYQHQFQRFDVLLFRDFLIKRIARIYPVYLVCLLITVLVVGGYLFFDFKYKHMDRFTGFGFVQSLTMTQALSFPIPRQWNIVAWSVSAEWMAYLCFPIVAVFANCLKRHVLRLFAIAVVGCGYVLLMNYIQRPSAMELGLVRVAGGFTMGVLVCGMRDILPDHWSNKRGWLLVGCLFLFVTPCWYAISMKLSVASVIWAPIAFAPVIFAFAQSGAQWGVMKSPRALYFGRVSYSLYMIHAIMLMVTRAVYSSKYIVDSSVFVKMSYIAVDIILVFAAAHILYTRVEEPARRIILKRALGERKNTQPS
jgi:peptidoglycan/LPS O-acetylase OafA/YrhL